MVKRFGVKDRKGYWIHAARGVHNLNCTNRTAMVKTTVNAKILGQGLRRGGRWFIGRPVEPLNMMIIKLRQGSRRLQ